jgi:anti-anti-sigma factor
MSFDVSKQGDKITVRFDGTLNFTSNEGFRAALDQVGKLGGREVVFDLANLAHIDSVGLGLLYIAKEDFEGLGLSLSLASPKGNVQRLLQLTDASQTFNIVG